MSSFDVMIADLFMTILLGFDIANQKYIQTINYIFPC